MSNHPLNLAVRFALEIALLIIFTMWGWNKFSGIQKYVLAIGLPLLVATLWGVFRVDGDPGKAVVAVPGWVRLLFEVILFVCTSYMLLSLKMNKWANIFIIISVIHYLVSYDRIKWLLTQ